MRVRVTGTSGPAKAVRTGLAAEGFAVTDRFSSYQIIVEEAEGDVPEVDGIDCELERQIVNCIAKIADTDVLLRRRGGIESDQRIRIAVPKDDGMASRVEQAIIKGFALAAGSQSGKRRKWFGKS